MVGPKLWQATKEKDLTNGQLERLLERLDRIAREVEDIADIIAEKLGLPIEDQDTQEISDDECTNQSEK